MKYLKTEDVVSSQIVCIHPRVKKFWEWGGCSLGSETMVHYCSILLDDDTRIDFCDNGDGLIYEEVEKFLETI